MEPQTRNEQALLDATDKARDVIKSSGNPGIAMLGISAFLMGMYLGIGALITGKSAIQIFTGVSLLLGQSPLLSAVMCWLSVIGLGAVLHGIFTATNSKPA